MGITVNCIKFGMTKTLPGYNNIYVEMEAEVLGGTIDENMSQLQQLVTKQVSQYTQEKRLEEDIHYANKELEYIKEQVAIRREEYNRIKTFLDGHPALVRAYEECTGKLIHDDLPF